ncbi:hypothetical protein K353_03462 [Kitasatospora sp. SolWspMP-SS2h]|uniref:ATP-binding protein n=1 Tax=Kitasatospora sp. SolWspMP-SS2h TaxID=1305729 RepID=UPI000DBABF22|nr:ATP-binding protein [Kitasatospora sp. SolWspMP-SS2h]RAJ39974.1 hypothetical protein K353_03462 [Kitasatospora sp. SolWspMP-SS2h]
MTADPLPGSSATTGPPRTASPPEVNAGTGTTYRPSPPDGPVELALPYTPPSAARARLLVGATLRAWNLADLVEAGELVVSELVTNAIETGCNLRMVVTVRRLNRRTVRVAVQDGSRSLPCLIDAGPGARNGYGLLLVHHFTRGYWGAALEGIGKTVHADLRAPEPPRSR